MNYEECKSLADYITDHSLDVVQDVLQERGFRIDFESCSSQDIYYSFLSFLINNIVEDSNEQSI